MDYNFIFGFSSLQLNSQIIEWIIILFLDFQVVSSLTFFSTWLIYSWLFNWLNKLHESERTQTKFFWFCTNKQCKYKILGNIFCIRIEKSSRIIFCRLIIFIKFFINYFTQVTVTQVMCYVQFKIQRSLHNSYPYKPNLIQFLLYREQWPDFGCEGIKVQRAHQPTSQCQGKKKQAQISNLELVASRAAMAYYVQFRITIHKNVAVI
eukprot:TRINITY_DN15177_c1_g1_i1.p2 TRINITY_DN15177_c1_g1~~TRINITY_DN15177_c1_g1_i1.p2  ORF type:complete len:207 (+),score=-1.31 TRINITY_DN15177_c1_g1_i1:54-674(+)